MLPPTLTIRIGCLVASLAKLSLTANFMIPINSDEPSSCAICSRSTINRIGSKDFGVSAGDHFEGRRLYPDYGIQIPYYECQDCFFIFSPAFDKWSKQDFETHIYNDEYVLGDKPFLKERPIRNANLVAALFHRECDAIDVLDFGGGAGLFSRELKRSGFRAETYDVHYENNVKPTRQFDLVTSFEVIEHVPHRDQHTWISNVRSLVKPTTQARVLLGTELVPHQGKRALDWWYISPRNGHISIHSRTSLDILAKSVGLDVFSANGSMHFLSPTANVQRTACAPFADLPSRPKII